MSSIAVLDRYTNKYLTIEQIPEADFANIKIGDKLVYGLPDAKTWVLKSSVWTVLENKPFKESLFISEREEQSNGKEGWLVGSYGRMLQGTEKADFENQQQIALKFFPTFRKEFQAEYPNSVPITARFQIFSNQLYFFFYSEERYIFTEFVKKFREKLGMNMFLFQVGARDMMRMSPGADMMYGSCGNKLCCKSHMVLPNIEIEAITLQNLEGRDIERLKGKCWKLKCCLLYELNLYIQESKRYPQKWSKLNTCTLTDHCKKTNCDAEECQGIVTSFNIITQEVNIKTKEGLLRISIEKFKK